MMEYLKKTMDMHRRMIDELDQTRILEISSAISSAYLEGKKLITFGNGGSAADAMHFAAELEGQLSPVDKGRAPYKAIAISNLSAITAIANDFGYEHVFERFVEANASAGDVVFAFSTSGQSKNVLRAVEKANALKAFTVGLTGQEGGQLKSLARLTLCVPSSNVSIIQEGHLVAYHRICALVVKTISGFDCLV